MRWLIRVFLVVAFLILACLAALPHLPWLRQEAALFYQTWQKTRQGHLSEKNPIQDSLVRQPESDRRRELVKPEPLTLKESASATPQDRFLEEARRRAEQDPEAAMQWLQSQSTGAERLRGMLEVVALWAAEDSESALLWLESNAQGLARLETLNSGVELWAARNPGAAAEWIDGMANDGSKVTAAKSLAATWVQTQPEQASTWVAGLPDGRIRDEAAAALANSWATQDPEAASIWAFAQAEFNGNTELLVTTIRSFTRQKPAEAEAFLRDMNEVAAAPTVLASHVIARAETDPSETAEWIANMSPDDPIYSPDYAGGLMQVWAQSDSIAASEWLSRQPQGGRRDAAVYGFSESIQRFEPAAAAAWANSIDDPEKRVVRLTESIQAWAQQEPAAAREWIVEAELEPALRKQLANDLGLPSYVAEPR